MERETNKVSNYLKFSLLILGALISIFPFYWMIVLSSHGASEVFSFPPPLVVGDKLLENYRNLLSVMPFWNSFTNSIVVSTARTSLSLFFCALAGFAFAKYKFPGKDTLFLLLLGTMMIPPVVGLVPWFVMMVRFGWINSFKALIIPGAVAPFGVFWMRQYIEQAIPNELIHAARVDGCPESLVFFLVILPLLKPALAVLGIMTFMTTWNDFMQPLLILKEAINYTLPVALSVLKGDPTKGSDYGLLMMGTSIATVPIIVGFLSSAQWFIAGLTAGAIKE